MILFTSQSALLRALASGFELPENCFAIWVSNQEAFATYREVWRVSPHDENFIAATGKIFRLSNAGQVRFLAPTKSDELVDAVKILTRLTPVKEVEKKIDVTFVGDFDACIQAAFGSQLQVVRHPDQPSKYKPTREW